MRNLIIVFLSIAIVAVACFAQEEEKVGFEGRPIINNLWMPTGYTLNKGEFIVGIGPIGFGISDKVQVGTNLLLYIVQYYNANVKVSLAETSNMAFAAGLDVGHFNLDVFDSETSFTSYSPYVALTNNIGPSTNLHFEGSYSHFEADVDVEDADVEATTSGTSLSGGIEYSLSYKTKFLGEVGYDFTFEGMRFGGGVLFGWQKLRIKLGIQYYNPKDSDGFTWPILGIWWRFMG
jgi:hypothetical protein